MGLNGSANLSVQIINQNTEARGGSEFSWIHLSGQNSFRSLSFLGAELGSWLSVVFPRFSGGREQDPMF